jgi:hypothetical protein
MNDFYLIDGTKRYNSSELVKMYGSEEKVLVNIYNWEKNNKITLNNNGNYERVYQ